MRKKSKIDLEGAVHSAVALDDQSSDLPLIALAIADDQHPDERIALTSERLQRLSEIPRLIQVLCKMLSIETGDTILNKGVVTIGQTKDQDLCDRAADLVSRLQLTAVQLIENSSRQPPLPVLQAVDHPHCVTPLRTAARAYLKSGLVAVLHKDGKTIDFPHPDVAIFTAPPEHADTSKFIDQPVIGLCRAVEVGNVVMLKGYLPLLLPSEHYLEDFASLSTKIFHGEVKFIGNMRRAGDHWVALSGGKLESQLPEKL